MFLKVKSELELKWRQYLVASLASYGTVGVGMSMGWTSPVLPHLRGENSPLPEPLTLQQGSTVGSLLLIGAMLGSLFTIPLSRYIGRKPVIMSSNIPLLLGWLLAGVATNVDYLYAARIMWGLAAGIQFSTVPVYIGEISEDHNRGALSALFLLFINVGFLAVYVAGRFTSYWGLAAVGGILSLVYLPFTCVLPETPFFLVFKENNEQAETNLIKLRGTSKQQVQPELEALKELVDREFKEKPTIKEIWGNPGTAKALGICTFLTMLVQLSGIDVMLFYMEELLIKVGTKMSPAEGTIIMGAVQVLTSTVTPLVVDRVGRKLLLWTTALGLFIVLCLLGLYALFDSYFKYDVSSIAFLPLLLLVIYMVLFTLGVGPVPWILVSEMFPVRTKTLTSGICSFMCWVAGAIWTRYFRDVVHNYGIYTAFWILAGCCFAGFLFSLLVLPETKGKTLEEIQLLLSKRSPAKKNNDEV